MSDPAVQPQCRFARCEGSIGCSPGQDAGLSATLADTSEKVTVFAPTDNAFSNLLAAIGLTGQQLLADPSTLGEARHRHAVVPVTAPYARDNLDPSLILMAAPLTKVT